MTLATDGLAEPVSSASRLTVRRLQPLIGAELSGVDLRRPLAAADRAAIYAAIVEHRVAVFRDQALTREQQIRFSRSFGDLEIHPLHADADYPEIMSIIADGKVNRAANIWHADHSYEQHPPSITVLRAVIAPSFGGDTVFSSAAAAYAGLPEAVKLKIGRLRAVHNAAHGFRQQGTTFSAELIRTVEGLYPARSQPVVRVLPDTGEHVLNVNVAYTSHIEGLSSAESADLLRYLTDQIKKPDYQLRLSWRPGSMVVWDNRAVQEYDLADHDEPRWLERCCVAGPAPLGPADLH